MLQEMGGGMAKKGGNPENLKPVRTSEEAKKRGSNGGKKSGAVRRQKRDARQAMNLILELAAKKNLDTNLKELGVKTEDSTNMVALQARLFTMAMSGNLEAYETVMKYAGYDPEENRKERESLAAENRKLKESLAKVQALTGEGTTTSLNVSIGEDEDNNDVIIYMPQIASEESCEPEEKDDEEKEESKDNKG